MKELSTIAFVILGISNSLTTAKQTDADPKTSMGQGRILTNSENLAEFMGVCNETFRTDVSLIEDLQNSGSFPDETDRTPKCFVRCVMEKSGIASEEGVYDPKVAGNVLAGMRGGKVMNDVEDLAKSCVMRDEQCKCERAYQFVKCLMGKEIEEYEKAQ